MGLNCTLPFHDENENRKSGLLSLLLAYLEKVSLYSVHKIMNMISENNFLSENRNTLTQYKHFFHCLFTSVFYLMVYLLG